MRYLMLVAVLSLAACGPRFDAARQCYQEEGGATANIAYGYGTIGSWFTAGTPEQAAYNQSLADCKARYMAKVNGG